LALFIATGVGIYVYFKNEKLKVEEKKREERASKSVGKVKIGGPFQLINAHNGQPFTEKDLLGKFSLIYVRPSSPLLPSPNLLCFRSPSCFISLPSLDSQIAPIFALRNWIRCVL
jgi:hypothetical protein